MALLIERIQIAFRLPSIANARRAYDLSLSGRLFRRRWPNTPQDWFNGASVWLAILSTHAVVFETLESMETPRCGKVWDVDDEKLQYLSCPKSAVLHPYFIFVNLNLLTLCRYFKQSFGGAWLWAVVVTVPHSYLVSLPCHSLGPLPAF